MADIIRRPPSVDWPTVILDVTTSLVNGIRDRLLEPGKNSAGSSQGRSKSYPTDPTAERGRPMYQTRYPAFVWVAITS